MKIYRNSVATAIPMLAVCGEPLWAEDAQFSDELRVRLAVLENRLAAFAKQENHAAEEAQPVESTEEIVSERAGNRDAVAHALNDKAELMASFKRRNDQTANLNFVTFTGGLNAGFGDYAEVI